MPYRCDKFCCGAGSDVKLTDSHYAGGEKSAGLHFAMLVWGAGLGKECL